MNHLIYTACPGCDARRATVVELVRADKCILITCNCGQSFAVHLRVSVEQHTVAVPRPDFGSVTITVCIPELSVASQAP